MMGFLSSGRPGDRGSATVWVLGLAALIWFLGAGVVLAAQARMARHQAAAAADLAALAAADRAAQGQKVACEVAGQVARRNGARLSGCAVWAGIADVTVTVPLPSAFGSLTGVESAMMRARAGPVGPTPLGAAVGARHRRVTPAMTNR